MQLTLGIVFSRRIEEKHRETSTRDERRWQANKKTTSALAVSLVATG